MLITYLVLCLYHVQVPVQVAIDLFDEILQELLKEGHSMTDLNGCLAMVGCSKATHRSTTLCMTVEAMYNSIVHGNHKLFNANHLRMIGDRPEEKLYDGYRWSYERAWSIFKLPPARYAQDSMTTGVMQGNFKKNLAASRRHKLGPGVCARDERAGKESL